MEPAEQLSEHFSEMAWGPDVSHYRPVRDWDALATSGATFFAAKATEGAHTVDDQFATQRDGFRQHCENFTLAIWYHFFHAERDPATQAEHLADVAGELGPRERLCCDFEGKSYSNPAVNPKNGLRLLEAFYARLDALGVLGTVRPLIYTSARHWEAIGDPAWERAAGIDLWVPRYHLPEPAAPARLPSPWTTWAILQYTDGDQGMHREVPGIGLCDCNVVAPVSG